jgi:Histone-like transcription factor (CBF/NF-Y) and archaeal histone
MLALAFQRLKLLFFLARASDKCQREKRKTINGDDLLWAMGTLGFEEYVEPLKIYLSKYREVRAPECLAGSQTTNVRADAFLDGGYIC